MTDQGSSPFGEEYLPTTFRDAKGSQYEIHVTVAVATEISRRHGLTLSDLAQAGSLPFHVLLDVAELGTRYAGKARSAQRGQTVDRFQDDLGEAGAMEAVGAAGNALLNFTLRANRDMPEDKRRAVASRLAAQAETMRTTMSQALESLLDGPGSTSGDSPELPESIPGT